MAQPPAHDTQAPPEHRPPGAPDPRRLDPVAVRRAGRRTGHFGLLALAAVLATGLPLPWGLAALAFTAAALVVGVVALVATVQAGLRPPTVVVLSLGLALVGLLLLLQLARLVFYPVAADDERCRAGAITARAVAQCQEDLQGRLVDQMLGR